MRLHEGARALRFPLLQLMTPGTCWRGDDQVLGDGQRRHQGEVLVDHAEAQGRGVARRVDLHLAAIDRHELPVVGW